MQAEKDAGSSIIQHWKPSEFENIIIPILPMDEKALEIINAMYPMETRTDKRIEEYFPELSSVFNGYTINDLINLSNNRKEARHFIKDKTKILSHESLNKKERILMYRCANCLLTNVIREKFGLSHQTIIYK